MPSWIDITYTYIVPILSLFGVLHEISVLLTLQFGNLRDSAYVYLKCIAWSDVLLLVLTIADCAHRWAVGQLSANAVLNIKRYYWSVSSHIKWKLTCRRILSFPGDRPIVQPPSEFPLETCVGENVLGNST